MVRMACVVLAFVVVGVTSCSVAYGQSLDFRIEGPTEVVAGEYVELRVEFPEGVQADVSFVPVEEDRFGVHPIVRETIVDGKLVPVVRGRVCTFSARCQGERDLTVVATAFASVGGVPRVHSLRHRIRVKSVEAPTPPPKNPPEELPPPPPKDDDDLGPRVPLPNASSDEDLDKIVRILGDVVDRLEALEQRSTPVVVKAPAADTSVPAGIPVVVAKPVSAVVDARPGHWNIAGDWNASKAKAITHLRSAHATKARQFEPLESLSLETILTLHDDAHEGRATSTSPPPVQRYVAPPANACPGGVCPTSSRSSYTTGPFGVIRWRR